MVFFRRSTSLSKATTGIVGQTTAGTAARITDTVEQITGIVVRIIGTAARTTGIVEQTIAVVGQITGPVAPTSAGRAEQTTHLNMGHGEAALTAA